MNPLSESRSLQDQLLYLLGGGGAHLSFEAAFAEIPPRMRGAKPKGLTYTPWRILEHMRIAQSDILEFMRDAAHVSPEFPDGYWPRTDGPRSQAAWHRSIRSFRADLEAIADIVRNPKTDLHAKIPHGTGQTILREVLLVADHNAYHLGQMVVVRELLGIPTKGF